MCPELRIVRGQRECDKVAAASKEANLCYAIFEFHHDEAQESDLPMDAIKVTLFHTVDNLGQTSSRQGCPLQGHEAYDPCLRIAIDILEFRLASFEDTHFVPGHEISVRSKALRVAHCTVENGKM